MKIRGLESSSNDLERDCLDTTPRKVPVIQELNKTVIADLSDEAIYAMERNELARLIQISDLPTLTEAESKGGLSNYDHPLLVRLAFRARRCCKSQLEPALVVGELECARTTTSLEYTF